MDIELLRNEIDKIDAEIASLLDKRTSIAQEIANIKKNKNIAVYAPDREEEILSNVLKYAKTLDKNNMQKIYEFILTVTKKQIL